MRAVRTTLFVALLSAPPLAQAHEFWVMPDAFALQVGQAPALQLRVGAGWPGEVRAADPERSVRWEWIDAAGTQNLLSSPNRASPSARVQGWAWAVYRSKHAQITLPADQFEAYLQQEGLEHVIQERRARGESQSPGREIYSRCAKALMHVDAELGVPARPTEAASLLAHDAQLALEIQPLSNPRQWLPGGQIQVALRFNGRPLRGALIKALPQTPVGSAARAVQARTNAAGRVSLTLPHGGVWLMNAVHMRRAGAGSGSGADWESFWSSMTLALSN
jgi:Domain of unknown function (DUF4198)